MKELKFKVELLTNVILNQKAATEGNRQTLDFIPGNNFLGIVSALYGKLTPQESLILFHSGKVKFGDAHPMRNGERSLHIPSSFYYAKLEGDKRVLVYHGIPKEDNDEIRSFEPKQFRNGFYFLSDCKEKKPLYELKYETEKSFAIKSAYDKDSRRSKEGQMYGYESLHKGSEWMFSVFIDDEVDEKLIGNIKDQLIGEKSIGRSRTAQYGLIKIDPIDNPSDYEIKIDLKGWRHALVYADARLIFLDAYGMPTLQPDAKALGFENGVIDWPRSQVRSFQYAPWNFKRQARDTDRCGIEKGSVFYIVQSGKEPIKYTGNHFVGVYQNEGFGKVIVNPDFLNVKEGSVLGESLYFENIKKPETSKPKADKDVECDDPVFQFLKKQKQEEENIQHIYQLVNTFVNDNKKAFLSDSFSSQWGAIRNISMQYSDENRLYENLFGTNGFLSKGVSKYKWLKNDRKMLLEEFYKKALDGYKRISLINLASEMSKVKIVNYEYGKIKI